MAIEKGGKPRLAAKIVKALNALHETDGASAKAIMKYLQTNFKTGPGVTEKDVAFALKKAVDGGMVVTRGGKYKAVGGGVLATETTDGRRRRRSRSRGGKRRRSRSRKRMGGSRRKRSRSRRRGRSGGRRRRR